MNIKKATTPQERKAIVKKLESIIKAHGFEKTRASVNHYFKNSTERIKAQKRITELQKEIATLEKKKY